MKELFAHKKFKAALIASLAALLGEYAAGLVTAGDYLQALTLVNWALVISPWLLAIGGQGLADIGKEKAKVEQGS